MRSVSAVLLNFKISQTHASFGGADGGGQGAAWAGACLLLLCASRRPDALCASGRLWLRASAPAAARKAGMHSGSCGYGWQGRHILRCLLWSCKGGAQCATQSIVHVLHLGAHLMSNGLRANRWIRALVQFGSVFAAALADFVRHPVPFWAQHIW